ncbi:MAG: rhodanese-like domain-containing protein [Phycisphaerales bacterium]|nr:rhodanese-like domain-containing protein [Phycisphaerales bacterium]
MKSRILLTLEVAVVLAIGVGAGLAYNTREGQHGKPHVDLHQQYFYRPAQQHAPPSARVQTDPGESVPGGHTRAGETPRGEGTDGLQGERQQHAKHEFSTIETARVEAIVDGSDPASSNTLIVDARDAEHFEEGRIPGAVRCYFSTLEEDFQSIKELAVDAGYQLVIYCNGGECEDSLNLCRALVLERGVPKENILLYEGGWEAWNQEGRPTETGPKDGEES